MARKRLFLISYLIVIFILHILPVSEMSLAKGKDKIIHFLLYFFLAGLFALNGFSLKKVFLYSFAYALFTEGVQIPLTYRDASLLDLAANLWGILSFCLLFFIRLRQESRVD